MMKHLKPVARVEAIRMLITFAAHTEFKLCQMDVKSAFLNGYLQEEVYVRHPPGFESHEYPNHVYKLDKTLYGLKQAPRAWYDRLSTFPLTHGYSRGKIDNTLFLKKRNSDVLIVQIYVDDIIFAGTDEQMGIDFAHLMSSEFEINMTRELYFFLRVQIKQSSAVTLIH